MQIHAFPRCAQRPCWLVRGGRIGRIGRVLACCGLILGLAAVQAATNSGEASDAAQAAAQAQALERAGDAVVALHVTVTEGATSAESLGDERTGSGVVIGPDGLILTIGYLLLEAETI
ncbi:MAG TPA: S1C family serine protease, partial [Variovorax sp.]